MLLTDHVKDKLTFEQDGGEENILDLLFLPRLPLLRKGPFYMEDDVLYLNFAAMHLNMMNRYSPKNSFGAHKSYFDI